MMLIALLIHTFGCIVKFMFKFMVFMISVALIVMSVANFIIFSVAIARGQFNIYHPAELLMCAFFFGVGIQLMIVLFKPKA